MGITEKDILKTVLKVPQLEEQLETIKNNAVITSNKIKDRVRQFKPKFGGCCDFTGKTNGNWWTNDLETIKKKIDVWKENYADEISITIKTSVENGVLTIKSDSTLFKQGMEYAISKGIKINCIKVHVNEFRVAIEETGANKESLKNQYKEVIQNLAITYKGYTDKFVVMNEGESIFQKGEYETFLIECLNIAKINGYKASLSLANVSQWNGLKDGIKYAMDYVCLNYYPDISTKGFNTSLNDVLVGFENGGIRKVIDDCKAMNKELTISETGCNDMPSCLSIPWIWDFNNGESLGDGTIQAIMLEGIYEYFKNEKVVTNIHHWFPFIGTKCKAVNFKYIGGVN